MVGLTGIEARRVEGLEVWFSKVVDWLLRNWLCLR